MFFRAPFKVQRIPEPGVPCYRIADADDNRIATCFDERNANHVAAALNRDAAARAKQSQRELED